MLIPIHLQLVDVECQYKVHEYGLTPLWRYDLCFITAVVLTFVVLYL